MLRVSGLGQADLWFALYQQQAYQHLSLPETGPIIALQAGTWHTLSLTYEDLTNSSINSRKPTRARIPDSSDPPDQEDSMCLPLHTPPGPKAEDNSKRRMRMHMQATYGPLAHLARPRSGLSPRHPANTFPLPANAYTSVLAAPTSFAIDGPETVVKDLEA